MTNKERQEVRRILWKWGQWTINIRRYEREIADVEKFKLNGKLHTQAQHTVIEIETDILDTMRLRLEIEKSIKNLTALQQRVITLRYVQNRSWANVSTMLDYSIDYIQKVEGKAIDAIAKKILS